METKSIIVTFLFIIALLSLSNCKKDKDEQKDLLVTEVKGLSIDSIISSRSSVKAWTDTANITVYASGDNLTISWEADHGSLAGEGKNILYFAGQCCVGLNTITCTVANDTAQVQDTIKINVTPYSR